MNNIEFSILCHSCTLLFVRYTLPDQIEDAFLYLSWEYFMCSCIFWSTSYAALRWVACQSVFAAVFPI